MTNPSNRSPRNPGADLLRIVSMLMILTSHFFVHGKVLGSLTPWDVNFYPSWFIEGCCYVMVNCFVLITGYFQSQASFRLKKLLLLWGQIIAASAGVYLLLCLTGVVEFETSAFLDAFFAVTKTRYWFATSYIILYAVSPLLNFVIRRMNRREHFVACTVLCGIFVLFRNFTYWADFANLHGGYSYTSFIVLYFLGAYLRRFPPKKHRWLAWYFGLSAITAASRIILTILYYRFEFDSSYLKMFMQYNSVTVVAASVCLFQFFVTRKIENPAAIRVISFFSPLTFGVYLIHEQIELKNFIWPLINPTRWLDSPKLFLALPVTVVLLFLACALLDKIRSLLSRILHIPALFERICQPAEKAAKRFVDHFTEN